MKGMAKLEGDTLGQRIVSAYERARMNRSDLSRAIDVHYTTIIGWEKNHKTPKYENLKKIAKATGVTLGALEGIEDLPDAKPVTAGGDALEEFLAGPIGRTATPRERQWLQEMDNYDGRATVATYQVTLVGLRSTLAPSPQDEQGDRDKAKLDLIPGRRRG